MDIQARAARYAAGRRVHLGDLIAKFTATARCGLISLPEFSCVVRSTETSSRQHSGLVR
jgi:hypothetical protein